MTVQKIREGTASQEEINSVVKQHIGLAIHIAGKYVIYAPHLRDVLIAEAMFGLMVAMSKAKDALYDDNITYYISRYIKKYVFLAVTEDRTVPVPYSTIKSREKRGLETIIPQRIEFHPSAPQSNLNELKEEIESCIRSQFEKQVIELRELGYKDPEISEMLHCNRVKVTLARNAVYERFVKK